MFRCFEESPRNNHIAAAPRRRPATPVATNFGLRRDQRHIRAGAEIGRATIRRPLSQFSKSSASARAEE